MRVNPAIIIPTHNDGRTIETTVRKAKELSSFIIVIDDGSTDGSGDLAKRAGAIVLKHGRNLGKGAALETGFRYAGSTDDPKSELIVTLDADGQHDPADIPKLLAMAEEKRALVIGNRFTSSNVMPPRRALGNRLASWIISLLIGQTVSDTQSGFRAFPVEFIKNGPFRQRGYGIETEMIFRAKKLGMPIEEVPIQVHDANMRMRTNDTKNRWNHLIKDIWRGINLGQAVITSAFSWKALIFPILLMLFFLQLRLIVNPLKNDISRIQAGLTKRRDSQTDEGTLAAFKWLKENTPSNAIILTPPYEAHRIMAFSDRRVIAGGKVYPSETKELASRLRDLSRFFFTTDTTEAKNVAQKYHANYIFLPKKPLFLNLCAAGGGCHWATYSGSKDLTPDGKKKTVIGRLLQGEPLSEFMLVRSLSRYLVFSIATSNPPLPNFGFTDEALRSRIKTSLSFLEKERPTTQTKETADQLLARKENIARDNVTKTRFLFELTESAKNEQNKRVIDTVNEMAPDLKEEFLEKRIFAGRTGGGLEVNAGIWLALSFKNLYEIDGRQDDARFALDLASWLLESQYPPGVAGRGGAFRELTTASDPSPLTTAAATQALMEIAGMAKSTGSPADRYEEAAEQALRWLLQRQPESAEVESNLVQAGLLYLRNKQL